jgi:hypothetical protein
MILSPNCGIYRKSILDQNGRGRSRQHSAVSIQPAQQLGGVFNRHPSQPGYKKQRKSEGSQNPLIPLKELGFKSMSVGEK